MLLHIDSIDKGKHTRRNHRMLLQYEPLTHQYLCISNNNVNLFFLSAYRRQTNARMDKLQKKKIPVYIANNREHRWTMVAAAGIHH